MKRWRKWSIIISPTKRRQPPKEEDIDEVRSVLKRFRPLVDPCSLDTKFPFKRYLYLPSQVMFYFQKWPKKFSNFEHSEVIRLHGILSTVRKCLLGGKNVHRIKLNGYLRSGFIC